MNPVALLDDSMTMHSQTRQRRVGSHSSVLTQHTVTEIYRLSDWIYYPLKPFPTSDMAQPYRIDENVKLIVYVIRAMA